MCAKCILVSAPAHLHAGNYEFTCDLGRCFGSVGVAVEKPRLEVIVCLSERLEVVSSEDKWCRELVSFAKRYSEKVYRITGVKHTVKLVRCYPWGVGLGARTALALSIALGVCRLADIPCNLEDIALELGRSMVSAVGLYTFTRGGLVVDAGFNPSCPGCRPPPLLARFEPNLWLLIAIPLGRIDEIRCLKEEVESRNRYPQAPEELSAKLARLLLVGFLGNMADGDVVKAFKALSEMNRVAGSYWRGLGQKGIYCCPEVEKLIEILEETDSLGVFQSSWGPTVWAVYSSFGSACEALQRVRSLAQEIGEMLLWITKVDNRGVRVSPLAL